MKRLSLVLACLVMVLAGGAPDAMAAKKKSQPAPAKPAAAKPAPSKPIYEAPMTVVLVRGWSRSCEPTCPEWIAAEGEITGATPAAFQRAFKAMGKKRLPIIIRSPGGSINAAVDIGRMIRKRGLDVAVGATRFQGCDPLDKNCKLPAEQQGIYRGAAMDIGGFCNSACPLILAGGKTRLAAYGTQVGVHQPKTIWTQQRYTYRETYRMINGQKKVLSRKIVARTNTGTKVTYGYDERLRKTLSAYYREMGIDTSILEDSNKASFKNMNVLNGIRVEELHLRTSGQSLAILTDPGICKKSATAGNCVRNTTSKAPAQPDKSAAAPVSPSVSGPEMTFTVVRNHNSQCEPACPAWIAAEGVISTKTPDAFRQLLQRLRKTRLPVAFNSLGGDLDAAITLAKLIRDEQMNTVVAGTILTACKDGGTSCVLQYPGAVPGAYLQQGKCNGACIAALSGGVRRGNAFDSEVVVYALAQDDKASTQQPEAVRLFSHFGRMGIGKDLMSRINAIPGNAKDAISVGTQKMVGLINEPDFKTIIPTPSRCANSGDSSACFRGVSVRLQP